MSSKHLRLPPVWKQVRNRFKSASRAHKKLRRETIPFLEVLEDRVVPTVIDLTTLGATGTFNGVIFDQFTPSSGTGKIDSFVRLSSNNATEQGYNTDFRPVQFDENSNSNYTRAIQLSTLPTVIAGGGQLYYEILLDINQSTSSPLLSLDQLRLYVTNSGTVGPNLLHNYN